jgi:hypothetical protein
MFWGVYDASLLVRHDATLGLSADIKAKTKLFPSGTEVAEAVAKGETEIGIGVASDAKIVPGKMRQPYQESAQAKRQFIEPIQRILPDEANHFWFSEMMSSPKIKNISVFARPKSVH